MTRIRCAASCLLAVAAACATPGQVQRVDAHISVVERNQARSDSMRDAESVRVLAAQQRLLDSLTVAVRTLQDNIAAGGRETAGEINDMMRLLSQLKEISNANVATMQRTAASVDAARAQLVAPPPPPAAGDTGVAHGAPPAGAAPSPEALFESGRTFLLKGSNISARLAFHQLIDAYPASGLVPSAMVNLGRTFDPDQPDSARVYYQQVVKNYPDSASAATALYKMAEIEERKTPPNIAGARVYYQQVATDRYKATDEYQGAVEWLQKHP